MTAAIRRLVVPPLGILLVCGVLILPLSSPGVPQDAPQGSGRSLPDRFAQADGFSFVAVADVRTFAGQGLYDTSSYFRGACEAMSAGPTPALVVSPGDMDPVDGAAWTIQQYVGSGTMWIPVVGNHELPGEGTEATLGANMEALRNYSHPAIHVGPSGCISTTYSFDYENTHFVVLNEYCDANGDTVTAGDIPDHLYAWLVADLAATDKAHIFVLGHEPAYPQPDADNGRLRHESDSLNQAAGNRDRFWNLLRAAGVTAYICGHTHNYSAVQVGGVWQVDVGHGRGLGDTGAASTFVVFHVGDEVVRFDTYRDDHQGGPYTLKHSGTLAWLRIYLPVVLATDASLSEVLAPPFSRSIW